ncbi:MAG: hypothetical protein ACOCSR_04815 [Wenzhouxiangella sp.]
MRICLSAIVMLLWITGATAQSPYAGEQERRIKALSEQRVAGLKSGRGLGYAKAAELNGYPGPMHVLKLADELDLDDDQRRRTQALFETMRERASALGAELVAAEAELDEAFADGGISRQRLAELVSKSARIEGQLRQTHLQAHLEQAELLDEAQIETYVRLRGYKGENDHSASHSHRHGGD